MEITIQIKLLKKKNYESIKFLIKTMNQLNSLKKL